MDPSLVKQKHAFKQRAIDATKKSQEIREAAAKAKKDISSLQPPKEVKKKKKKRPRPTTPRPSGVSDSPANKLLHLSENPRRLLKGVIDTMKDRHSKKNYKPLTFNQILLEIGCSALRDDLKQTLLYDLKNNTKMHYNSDSDSFLFKPELGLHVRKRKQLLKCLEENDVEGRGGILKSEITEAVFDPDTAMKRLETDGLIYRITRQDKEEVIFYKNSDYELEAPLSEEFKSHWHRVSVEGMTDDDIEKYLQNVGIGAMGGEGRKRKAPGEGEKKTKKRSRTTKMLNVHLDESVLKDYSSEAKP